MLRSLALKISVKISSLKPVTTGYNLYHPELEDAIPYCGPFIHLSETPVDYQRRAPLIGEHNREIYMGELGLSERMNSDKIIERKGSNLTGKDKNDG